MNAVTIIALITDIVVLVGLIPPVISWIIKIANGTKCQLRSDMLRIYREHQEAKEIGQYDYENFVFLYESYKALKGNSFIDKIYSEIKTWEITIKE